MQRFSMLAICLFLLACLTATTAWATSVHYKKGPTCVDNGLTATCTGTLSGLGNYDILANLSTTGTGASTCTNPGGNTKVTDVDSDFDGNPNGPGDYQGQAAWGAGAVAFFSDHRDANATNDSTTGFIAGGFEIYASRKP